jgi:hypothetical protein
MDNDDTAESITIAVFLQPTAVSYAPRPGLTHRDGIDLARDPDRGVFTAKHVDRVVELSLVDFNLTIVLMVFLSSAWFPSNYLQ